MVDSGACFTMVTEQMVERHALRMSSYRNTFSQAAPGAVPGELVGQVDFQLQLAPDLVLDLHRVKVQAGKGEYSIILGTDVLKPSKFLRGTSIRVG